MIVVVVIIIADHADSGFGGARWWCRYIAADNGINGGIDNTSIWRWFWWCHVVVVVHYAWC